MLTLTFLEAFAAAVLLYTLGTATGIFVGSLYRAAKRGDEQLGITDDTSEQVRGL